MPSIILEFFCSGNAIFDCGAKQKYQINSQLCGGTDHYVVSFLHRRQPVTKTAKLEGFHSPDIEGRYGETTVEIICHVQFDVG